MIRRLIVLVVFAGAVIYAWQSGLIEQAAAWVGEKVAEIGSDTAERMTNSE